MDNFFFFIHIPKTAGLTFRSIMWRNFGRQHKSFSFDFFEEPISVETLRASLKQGSIIRAASSHRFSADLPYELDNFNIVGVAFVRDPVERFISNYYYVKKLPLNNAITASESLEEFVSQVEECGGEDRHRNLQSRNLKLSYDELKNRLKQGQLHVFPNDRFDEALISLNKLYPNDFVDVSYSAKNVNKTKPRVISKEIKRRIAEIETDDLKIYQLASEHLELTLKTIFQGNEIDHRLRKLRTTCKLRALFLDPLVNLSEKVYVGIRSLKL